MATTVVNIRSCPAGWQRNPQFVYIGRPGKGLSGYYGNPFRLMREQDRDELLHRYWDWAAERIHRDPQFWDMVNHLNGKTLVCFCSPRKCHGDVLLLLAQYILAHPEQRPKEASK